MTDLLPNLPSGPLSTYRQKASFDWKQMKIFIDGEDVIKFENDIYERIQNDAAFTKDLLTNSFQEERYNTAMQYLKFCKMRRDAFEDAYSNMKMKVLAAALRIMVQCCPSTTIKTSISTSMFPSVIMSLGTEKQFHLVDEIAEGKIVGCFCLTEIGHGSNAKGMQTRAIYDKTTKNFILNTPNFEAAKCWAGSLGQVGSYAIVYAQLYIEEKHYGLHIFAVPIRDPKTLLPYPGVIVGDMGEKVGLNGVDNGFLMFNNYHVSRDALLDKSVGVTEDGQYVTSFKDSQKMHGKSLGALSTGRVSITNICQAYGTKAISIAIRYAAVRKQFGPEGQEEIPILEYQSHQFRLLPYLAATYAYRIFSYYLTHVYFEFLMGSFDPTDSERNSNMGMELHAISSVSKSVAGWTFRDCIQECREACGGHGYLKVAGFGELRNDNDANCTYEGENHVLIQQTSNWLLKFAKQIEHGQKIETPLGSVNFLSHFNQILKSKLKATNVDEMCQSDNIISAFQWIICYLLKQTKSKHDEIIVKTKDAFRAKNDSQVFYAKNLSIAYMQHFIVVQMKTKVDDASNESIKSVLLKLMSLYGLWQLEKFLPTLYEGGYTVGPNASKFIHDGILKLCFELKNDAVALIDVIAPPDFLLNSVLGAADGMVYKRLYSAMLRSPHCMSRPSWWKDFVYNLHPDLKGKL